jgi:beta-xylosidase
MISLNCAQAQETSRRWGEWQRWGDQGDGTYLNPVLPADFSDIDCIRVGSNYYAISSTFQFSPGMVILQSKDLVNWKIAGHAVSDLTQIGPELGWERMNRYGRGIWAGALRYHDKKFQLYFGTPEEGYFMTTASKPEGPWEPLHKILGESGWDDCCPFWDEDGQGYFVGTQFNQNYKTYIYKMTPDGRDIIKESRVLINEGAGREANKLYKWNGWYYHFFSEVGGDGGRYTMMQRSKNIFGPYSEKKQLTHTNWEANEPNQGGIVQTPNGDWYFLTHHGHGDWSGRIMSLLPVTWIDGWPIIGKVAPDGVGDMVWSGPKPIRGPLVTLQTDDDFASSKLAPQWEWNYQPRTEKWSLKEKRGSLRLHAFKPLKTNDLLWAGNTLTQRSMRTSRNEVTLKLNLSGMVSGQKAGLCHFAAPSYSSLGIVQEGITRQLVYRQDDKTVDGPTITGDNLWIRSRWGLDGRSQYFYSQDGRTFTDFGPPYQLQWGSYRGDRIGIYNYNDTAEAGYIDVDSFRYDYDKTGAAKP